MKNRIFIRFLLAGLACAMALGILTLLALRSLTVNSDSEFRRHLLLSLAQIAESGPIESTIERYEGAQLSGRHFRGRIWVIAENGKILSSNNDAALPERWESLSKPDKPHDISHSYATLGLTPAATVMRLQTAEPAYLVVASQTGNRGQRRDLLQVAFFGIALAFSTILSLLITFLYLRRKSRQARAVLLRLERGDLKARFCIRQFDEMGSLMLDFNRMASEIERLVGRLEETEQARKHLFQELSHDLRTPLTSLRTSVDILALHWEEMSADDRTHVVTVCQTEIAYFMDLLENLLFIANMDEPRYKKTTEAVSLSEILNAEIRTRKASQKLGSTSPMQWTLELLPHAAEATIPGDSHLIRRMVKNILENAARFAKSEIRITLSTDDSHLSLRVRDDGPGMSREEIALFGKLRNRRLVDSRDLTHVSLGLGSAIISKIVALHDGRLSIQSGRAGTLDGGAGTLIEVVLPRG